MGVNGKIQTSRMSSLRLAVFYRSRRLVPLPVPSPCLSLHVPSFQMHQTTAPAVSSWSAHCSFSSKSLAPLFLWLTPLPSQAHLNITSRKPPLTCQPISVPASGSLYSTNGLLPCHPLSTLTVLPSWNHWFAHVSPTF